MWGGRGGLLRTVQLLGQATPRNHSLSPSCAARSAESGIAMGLGNGRERSERRSMRAQRATFMAGVEVSPEKTAAPR